ncbi:BPL-N domain-containing protein [Bremerella cremea]|uniref:BPL-N domain-containing protein n=1 Tax=Bremerella cremea TaxID=1031537 RepID=UPI0031EEE828
MTLPGMKAVFAAACCLMATLTNTTLAEETTPITAIEPVKVAVYDHSGGTANGPKDLAKFLIAENGFQMTIVTPQEIRDGVLMNGFDVLVMPGGMASAQAKNLEESGRDEVRRYVKSGGGYVGICAGAYLSTTYKPWALGIVNAKVWDLAHWARGTGMVKLEMTPSGCSTLKMPKDQVEVYYGQGPMIVPGNDPDLPGYEILATYGSEIAAKGAPEGAMVGMHAIVRTMYGKGRVVAFSPHPEKKYGPESLMAEGIRWAGRGDQ